MTKFLSNINLEAASDIQFKTTAGANAGKIEQDGNNLVLSNAVGDVLLGDGSSDVYIGDGTNNVDIIFEQSGSIKGDGSAVTLTLGGSGTTLNLESPNISGNLTMPTAGNQIRIGSFTNGSNNSGEYANDDLVIGDGSISIYPHRRGDYGLNETSATSTTFRSKLNIWSDAEDHITFGGANTHMVSAWEGFKIWINNDSAGAGTLYLYNKSAKTEFARFSGDASTSFITGKFFVNGELEATSLDIDGDADISGVVKLDSELQFLRGSSEYSNYIRASNWPSISGYDTSTTKYWLEYGSKGGHHFVVNTDGGAGSSENATDYFTIWNGAVDGDNVFNVSNVGNTTIAGSVTTGGTVNVNNAGADKKMSFDRTGGKGISIEHDANGMYFYNETDSSVMFQMFNAGKIATSGEIEGGSLDINGNADISGTLNVHEGVEIADVIDGEFTALRLMNQKTYGSGTGTNEKVRFVMGISESGQAFSAREGFAIDLGIQDQSDSSNGVVLFKVRDGGTLGTYQTVNGHDKSVAFAGTVTAGGTTLTGDQDLSSYLTSYTVTQGDVTTHQAALSVTESQISDLQSYTTGAHPTDFVSAASGGTFAGSLQVDKTLSLGSGSSRFIFHSGTASVTGSGTANATEIDWKDSTHYIPSLAYAFRVKLVVTGTGTKTGASYIVYYNNATSAWVSRYITIAGTTSNHAQLTMVTDGTGTYMAAYHTHSGNYNIRYWVETFDSGDQDMDAHAFGSDFQWQRNNDTLTYADGAVTISNSLEVGGNITVTGNLTVNGTTVTVDTTNLNVQDNNITLNYSTGDSSSSADNAGITIQDAVDASNNATMLWDATNDKFVFSHAITAGGVALTGDQDLSSFITSQRAISSTPADNASTTAISSEWAFDNVKTAVPTSAVFTDTVNTLAIGVGSGDAMAGDTSIPSGNSIIDWTSDQSSTNIHVNNVVGYINSTEPNEPFNPFAGQKFHDGVLTNALAGRHDRFVVTIDGTTETGASLKLSNQNFEEYNQNRLFGTSAGETKVFNINIQSLASGSSNSNGVVYSSGYFDINFYSSPFPASWSARVKNRDGNWTTVSSLTKIGNSKLRGVIPISNYLTDIEFTLVARTSAPFVTGNITYGISEFEIYFSRMAASQGGNISAIGGYLGGTITTASGTTSANWNTAYGWGDHASGNYLTASSTDLDSRYYTETEVTNLLANKTDLNSIRSLGANAFTNGSNPSINTSQVMSEIESDGGFDSYSSVFKTSWSYAGNYNLTDAGRFTETAGSSWITWTDNSSDTTRGNITALAIAPNTGGSAGKVFIYNDQGGGYSPGWREVWTSTSDGASSGLDADLLDGQEGTHYLAYANLTGKPATFAPIIGSTSATAMAGNTTIPSGNQILDWTASQGGETKIHSNNITFPTMYTHPSYATTNINTTGSTIIDSITTNGTGHITAMGTRTLALSDLGFSGNSAANCVLNADQTLTTKTINADNNTITNIEVDNFKASAIVIESEGISSNDNDTTIPTSAAVKDYVDSAVIADTDTQDLGISGNSVTLDRGGSADISTITAVANNTAKTSFPGFGTSNTTALRGDTSIPSISGLASTSYVDTAEADAITAAASAAASIYVPSTGTTTIGGTKTFTGSLILNDSSGSSPTMRFMNTTSPTEDEVSIFCNTSGKMKFQQKLASVGSNVVQMTMDENGLHVDNGLKVGTGATVTTILDEDAMGSNSATALATQQSIKAYVTSSVAGAGGGTMSNWLLASSGTSGTETIDQGETVTFAGGTGITTSRNGQQINIVNSAPATSAHLNSNVTLSTLGAQAAGTYSTATGVENNADVTDSTNVTAAGALMDGDFTASGLMKRGSSSGSYSVITDGSSNWDTAYGWGDHGSAGYLTSVTVPNNHVTLARMAGGTDGELITYDSNGDPDHVAVGTNGHVLTSNGAGNAPTFQAASGGGGGGGVTVQEEGSSLSTTATTLNFTGSAITASGTGATKTINVVANNYSHPTTAGNKHVPTGGSSGQFLKYSSSGTATWATPSYTTNTNTQRAAGNGMALDSNEMDLDIDGQTAVTAARRDTMFIIDDPNDTGANALKKLSLYNMMEDMTDGAQSYTGSLTTGTSSPGQANSRFNLSVKCDTSNGAIQTSSSGLQVKVRGDIGINANGLGLNEDLTVVDTIYNAALHVGYASNAMHCDYSAATSTGEIRWYRGTVEVMALGYEGNLEVLDDVTADSQVLTSDRKLKKNIEPLNYGLNEVLKLKPVRYEWKESYKKGKGTMVGFVSQDVQEVIPEVINESKIIGTEETKLGIDYSKIVAVLTNAIQEQQKQIDELKKIVYGNTN